MKENFNTKCLKGGIIFVQILLSFTLSPCIIKWNEVYMLVSELLLIGSIYTYY